MCLFFLYLLGTIVLEISCGIFYTTYLDIHGVSDMNEGYVLVVCLNCRFKGLVPMFTGESKDDMTCPNCNSDNIEVS